MEKKRQCRTCEEYKSQEEYGPSIWERASHLVVDCKVCVTNKARSDSFMRDKSKGHIYIITNPAWEGWCKIGLSTNLSGRLTSYQTGSPFRDYNLSYSAEAEKLSTLEIRIHETLTAIGYERSNEWFKVPIAGAIDIIEQVLAVHNRILNNLRETCPEDIQ